MQFKYKSQTLAATAKQYGKNIMKTLIIENWPLIPVDKSPFGKERTEEGKDLMPDIDFLLNKAKENGFDLPGEAFIHNLKCFALDYKSNYHHKGINVFSPCSCNDLYFKISRGEGKTYYA